MLDKASQSSASFVHLMEDDIDISDSFSKLVQDDLLLGILARQKVVCTDAYVSPRQCLALLNALTEAKCDGHQWLEISCGFRIPCLNSLLLTPEVARRLCLELQAALRKVIHCMQLMLSLLRCSGLDHDCSVCNQSQAESCFSGCNACRYRECFSGQS